jgi:hypothetical protein
MRHWAVIVQLSAAIARLGRLMMRPAMLLGCVLALFTAGQFAAFDLGQDARAAIVAGVTAGVSADCSALADAPEDDASGKAAHCGTCCLHHMAGDAAMSAEIPDPPPRTAVFETYDAPALRPILAGRLPEPPRA